MNGRPIIGAVLITLLSLGQPVLAATEISSDIEGDVTWTKENSPYQVTIPINFSAATPGATLTVEPGTVVEFSSNASINVFGNLVVTGTEAEPVTFTGNAGADWQVLVFESAQSTISHLNASNASYGLLLFDSTVNLSNLNFNETDILTDNSNVQVNQLEMEGGSLLTFGGQLNLTGGVVNNVNNGFGFIADNSSLNISGLAVNNSAQGLNVSNSNATLNGINTTNTNGPALNISQSTVSVSNSTFNGGNSIGVGVSSDSVAQLNDVTVTNFMAPGIAVDYSDITGTGINVSTNLIGIATANSNLSIVRSSLKTNTLFGLDHSNEGVVSVSGSSIGGNGMAGVIGNGTNAVDARGNYWGHSGGPTIDPTNPNAVPLGDGVMGNVIYEPWLPEYCESECHSNIMFLPGIMSSRLYENGEQLWEPSALTLDREFEPLYLDENGKSINPNIVTKDVLDNGYAYGQFVEDLEALKTEGTINDFEAVAYDWRLSMEDVLNTGIKNDDGTILYGTATNEPYIEKTLKRLATNSKSGKVTIVAHSNGGLVTKALINKLGGEAESLIDKIIFVGVPQLGTPQAIGSLLHGYNAGLPDIYPFVLSPERARDLAINMPMIYQLMPFSDYYNGEGASVGTPYVTFEDGAATQAFIDRYGYAVTPDELESFLNGEEGRISAEYEDLENPINANPAMLANALLAQEAINSSWNAPDGIEVHQIAGIGEYTLENINYKTVKDCFGAACFAFDFIDKLTYKPNEMIDGDGTVVVSSALAMSDIEPNIERWWVNLHKHNQLLQFNINREHSDIFEVNELRAFIINNLLLKTDTPLPEYISNTMPEIEENDRLVFTLHSPLALSAVDGHGNTTNGKQASIPGARYTRYGEVQVLTIPADNKFTLVLTGEGEGSFTLEMEEFKGSDIIATSTLSAIPTSTSTLASINFTEGSLENAGVLQVDYNGDSFVDLTYTPILSQTVIVPDVATTKAPITTRSSGTGSHAQPQVLGVTSDLTQLAQLVSQLQSAVTALSLIKGQIPDEQYKAIAAQLQKILNAIEKLLQEQERL